MLPTELAGHRIKWENSPARQADLFPTQNTLLLGTEQRSPLIVLQQFSQPRAGFLFLLLLLEWETLSFKFTTRYLLVTREIDNFFKKYFSASQPEVVS